MKQHNYFNFPDEERARQYFAVMATSQKFGTHLYHWMNKNKAELNFDNCKIEPKDFTLQSSITHSDIERFLKNATSLTFWNVSDYVSPIFTLNSVNDIFYVLTF